MQLEDILEPANVHSWRENYNSDEAPKVEEDSILAMELNECTDSWTAGVTSK